MKGKKEKKVKHPYNFWLPTCAIMYRNVAIFRDCLGEQNSNIVSFSKIKSIDH
jgi:hypothetical protein